MICKDNMREHDMTKLSNFLSEMRGDILRDIDMRTCDNPYRLSANKVIEIVNGAFDVAISVAKENGM